MSVVTIRPRRLPSQPLPANRFTTDLTVRMETREQTISGVIPGDALMVESSDGNDFILLESDSGSGSSYIQLES